MPKIEVGFNARDRMVRFLRRAGYRNARGIMRDVIGDFFEILAADLRDGRSDWPVDTGFSRASFYGNRRGLFNHADYSIYVEGNTGAVKRYVRSQWRRLMARVLRQAGYPPPSRRGVPRGRGPRPRPSLFNRLRRLGRLGGINRRRNRNG